MKVPLSWLKEYVDISLPVTELAERLTLAGLEVSNIQYLGIEGAVLPWDRERIVVGHILAVRPHPNADRLVLADVDYGADQIETVVTGAPNLFPYLGQDVRHLNLKSPFALEGALLFDGHKDDGSKMVLKGRPVRGIMNRHMLCSEKELGISDNHTGILILDPDAPTGAPLADVLGTAVLDIELTPSIARCASIIGVAREVAALTGQRVRYPDYTHLPLEGSPLSGRVVIETEEAHLNPRFCAALIEGIQIKPSPYWMQLRLRLAGMRPINNVVDVSNYVMLEVGQPNHAFDYDVLRARADRYAGPEQPIRIITRCAREGEFIRTLDGVERALQPFTMLVTDPAGPLSIGGIMGGAESEVHENTRNVLLEAAAWDFINIRRSVQAYGLNSEAAYRFSRGVHPSQAWWGALRAAQLIQQLAGGVIARDILDYYFAPPPLVHVDLPMTEVKRVLGIDLPRQEVRRILEALEFQVEGDEYEVFHVTVPDHRMDIGTGVVGRADLIEEIARIYGYDRFPNTQIQDVMPPQRDNPSLLNEERIRDLLIEVGLQEVMTYRLTAPQREALLLPPNAPPDERPYITLANPISPERTVMRHRLLAGVLDVLAQNLRHRERVAVFEIGPVFLLPSEQGVLPDEVPTLCIALSGSREPVTWHGSNTRPMDFFDLKGILEALLEGLHIHPVGFRPADHPSYHPGRTAQLLVEEEVIGVFGQLHPWVQEAFDLPLQRPVAAAELDLRRLEAHIPAHFTVRPLPRFPAIRQDIALIVDENIPAQQVEDAIIKAGGKMLVGVHLFDVYQGAQIGPGKKSLAYTLTFSAEDRTLTDQEVARMQARIVRSLEISLGARLRG
ncbi:MAG: phenylalanine--tRNA ligase subunit beta [Anaerolineae bacterium]